MSAAPSLEALSTTMISTATSAAWAATEARQSRRRSRQFQLTMHTDTSIRSASGAAPARRAGGKVRGKRQGVAGTRDVLCCMRLPCTRTRSLPAGAVRQGQVSNMRARLVSTASRLAAARGAARPAAPRRPATRLSAASKPSVVAEIILPRRYDAGSKRKTTALTIRGDAHGPEGEIGPDHLRRPVVHGTRPAGKPHVREDEIAGPTPWHLDHHPVGSVVGDYSVGSAGGRPGVGINRTFQKNGPRQVGRSVRPLGRCAAQEAGPRPPATTKARGNASRFS